MEFARHDPDSEAGVRAMRLAHIDKTSPGDYRWLNEQGSNEQVERTVRAYGGRKIREPIRS